MLNWLSIVIRIRETRVRIKAKAAISSYTTASRQPLESRCSRKHWKTRDLHHCKSHWSWKWQLICN